MGHSILGGIPILLFIVITVITKKTALSAWISSLLAIIMLKGIHFIPEYIQTLYDVLSDNSFQLLLIVAMGFSGIAAVLEKSGAMLGFQNILRKVCKNRRSTLFFTWILGGIIFIDDYLNALAVSASMKGISDNYKIPREHLAYTTNCMGACVCVLVPISSWAAFAVGIGAAYNVGPNDYLQAIPFMFYPITSIILCLLTGFDLFPKIGALKKAYLRVQTNGNVLDNQDCNVKEIDTRSLKATSPWNFLIPVGVLIIGIILADSDLVVGMILAIVSMFFLFVPQKIFKVDSFLETFTSGMSAVLPLILNIFAVYIMENASAKMGFMDALAQLISTHFPKVILPMMAFISVAAITFFAASFWALIVISYPIFIPMAAATGIPAYIIIAAIMSGVALGSQSCLYSDAIFMVSAGTGVSNARQFEVVLPYTIIGAAFASVLFLVVGIRLAM